MNSALDKLLMAIENETRMPIQSFVFRFGEFEFDYMGRYYAYVYRGSSRNTETEDEYGWRNYADMLGGRIHQTDKTVREMLSCLPPSDLEIEYDLPEQDPSTP